MNMNSYMVTYAVLDTRTGQWCDSDVVVRAENAEDAKVEARLVAHDEYPQLQLQVVGEPKRLRNRF